VRLVDLHPEPDDIRQDVLAGLSRDPKSLPCKYFYDLAGSRLFDRITELPEYYPTRTELWILREHLGEMAALLGPDCEVVEYGSGSGMKTELLLEALVDPAAYVPVEISRDHLLASAQALADSHPDLEVLPVCGDFTKPFPMPAPDHSAGRGVVFFPGSTIGNFTPDEAHTLLRQSAELVGEGGALLIGTDLQKDPAVLEAAYDDAQGVTAAFNLNLLTRINREVGADFDPARFRHVAQWEPGPGRIGIYLESREDQTVRVGDRDIRFTAGERIHTESSHKYTREGFEAMAGAAGWRCVQAWTDPREWFAVWLFEVRPA